MSRYLCSEVKYGQDDVGGYDPPSISSPGIVYVPRTLWCTMWRVRLPSNVNNTIKAVEHQSQTTQLRQIDASCRRSSCLMICQYSSVCYHNALRYFRSVCHYTGQAPLDIVRRVQISALLRIDPLLQIIFPAQPHSHLTLFRALQTNPTQSIRKLNNQHFSQITLQPTNTSTN